MLLLSSCGNDGSVQEAGTDRKGQATPVEVGMVRQQDVPIQIRAIGNVDPRAAVAVKSLAGGQLVRVHFREGQDVRKGDLLFTIDPRPFNQAVREAEANLANGRAMLRQAEAESDRSIAEARNAQSQAARYASLAAEGIISREQREQTRTTAVVAEKAASASAAAIESARARMQGSESQLADAKLQLSYTAIRAPISGRTGSLRVREGNLVTANDDQPLVVINQVSPIGVIFSIPERLLGEVRSHLSPGNQLPVEAVIGESGGDTVKGKLDLIENEVDRTTGTIRMRAVFPNKDSRLWPGQFVNVVMTLATRNETVVPSRAVQSGQQGQYVFIVKQDMTAEQRQVVSDRTYGDLTVVTEGVLPDERVVTNGQLRLKPGAKLKIVGDNRQKEASEQPERARQAKGL